MITEEFLLSIGYVKHESLVLDSYALSITKFPDTELKQISCTIEIGNQYVYVRQGLLHEKRNADDVVAIFNSDTHGVLTNEWIEKLVNLLK